MTDGFTCPRIKQAAGSTEFEPARNHFLSLLRLTASLSFWWHFTSKIADNGFFCHILTKIAPFSHWNNDSQTLKACVCICFTLAVQLHQKRSLRRRRQRLWCVNFSFKIFVKTFRHFECFQIEIRREKVVKIHDLTKLASQFSTAFVTILWSVKKHYRKKGPWARSFKHLDRFEIIRLFLSVFSWNCRPNKSQNVQVYPSVQRL